MIGLGSDKKRFSSDPWDEQNMVLKKGLNVILQVWNIVFDFFYANFNSHRRCWVVLLLVRMHSTAFLFLLILLLMSIANIIGIYSIFG